MLASKNPVWSISLWQRDRIQRAFELEWQQCCRIKIPAAVAGLAVMGVLTTALWSPFADATGHCRTSPLVFRPGATVETQVTVAQQQACSVYVNPGSAMVNAMAVTAPPSAGTVSARGRTGVVYRASAGFRGDDTFAFVLSGKIREDVAPMTVKVRVSVR